MKENTWQWFQLLVPKSETTLGTANDLACGYYNSIEELKDTFPKGTRVLKASCIGGMINKGYDFSDVWVVPTIIKMSDIDYIYFREA